jgi:hypothetical protein
MEGGMKTHARTAAAFLLGLFIPLHAGNSPAEAQELSEVDAGIFKSNDLNNDGKISREEIIRYGDLVFLSTRIPQMDRQASCSARQI